MDISQCILENLKPLLTFQSYYFNHKILWTLGTTRQFCEQVCK